MSCPGAVEQRLEVQAAGDSSGGCDGGRRAQGHRDRPGHDPGASGQLRDVLV